MNITQLLEAASKLSYEDQRALNHGLCEIMKRSSRVKATIVGASFVPGMLVRFDAKRKGIKTIKIDTFNRAGTAVVGYEVNAQGEKLPFGMRWTVATTLCSKVA